MALSPGARIGAYKIVAPIGAGGMGEVYRAHDPRLGRDVAIKVLPEPFSKDPDRLRRFEQEARATGILNHPNVLAIYDVGAHEGSPYIVSELLEGETLRAALTGGAIAPRRAIDYSAQIASGLAAAHEKGFVHRDLKPENLFVTKDGRVKILDFGLAKLTQVSEENRSQLPTIASEPGAVLGTVGYMSPEQVRAQAVDHRTDIFAFGAILYELLSGSRAFYRGSAVETMNAILKDEPPDLESQHKNIPPALDRIVRRCLEKQPERRFQSAADLGFALESLSGTSVAAAIHPAGSVERRSPRTILAVATIAVLFAVAAFFAGARMGGTQGRDDWHGELLGGSAVAFAPRISPDGRLLAFQAMIGNLTQVAVMNPETGDWETKTHATDRGSVFEQCWSTDGNLIYFDRFFEQPRGIFSVPAVGEGVENLVLEDAMWPVALADGSLVVTKINAGAKELYRYWPETRRLESLGARPASFLGNPGVRSVPGKLQVVYFGKPKGSKEILDHLYALDLDSGTTRRIAPNVVFPQTNWYFALAVTSDGNVLFDLPSGDLQHIVAAPLSGSDNLHQVLTLTNFPVALDIGPDGSFYADQAEQTDEILRFNPVDGRLDRFPLPGREPGYEFLLSLPDGRVVATRRTSGRERLLALTPDGLVKRMIDTKEETTGPVTMLGANRLAFLQGSGTDRTVAIATLDGRPERRIPHLKGDFQSLAGAPDGKTLYYVRAGEVWSTPVSETSAEKPHRIRTGIAVTVEPGGQYLVILLVEAESTRLIRYTLPNGPEQPIPINGDLRPILGSNRLGPQAVASDGRIVVSLASKSAWNWPAAILNPRTGEAGIIPPGFELDMVAAGWDFSGRVVVDGTSNRSSLWRFRPVKRQN